MLQQKIADGIYKVTTRIATRKASSVITFTFRLTQPLEEARHVFSPLLVRFLSALPLRQAQPFFETLELPGAKRAIEVGMRSVQVFVKGPGAGRESALRALMRSSMLSQLSSKA